MTEHVIELSIRFADGRLVVLSQQQVERVSGAFAQHALAQQSGSLDLRFITRSPGLALAAFAMRSQIRAAYPLALHRLCMDAAPVRCLANPSLRSFPEA